MTSEEPRFALTLITGDPLWASAACEAGVDRLLVDLERLGKASRQQGRDLFISTHDWADVEAVRAVAPPGTLMVRLDPWHAGTAEQVDRAVGCGVDFVMLPYFFSADDVFRLVDLTKGRVGVVPLVETLSAIRDLPRLLASGSISDFHLGLNDLAIDMKLMSHAALWTSDLLEEARPSRGRRRSVSGSEASPIPAIEGSISIRPGSSAGRPGWARPAAFSAGISEPSRFQTPRRTPSPRPSARYGAATPTRALPLHRP